MQYQAVVFEPGQEGKVMMITPEDFHGILGGTYEFAYNKHDIPFTEVIVNGDGIGLNLPYNRGYFGTFIVVKEDTDEESKQLLLSEEEIVQIKKELDNKPNFSPKKSAYLARFFDEKELDTVMFHYAEGNKMLQITNYDVIFRLLNSDEKDMLKQAEDIIRKIDFKNGDINHFLEHMGKAIADSTFAQTPDF